MNTMTRKTRACTMETLDEKLQATIHTHKTKYGLVDLETNILMCCEIASVPPKKGLFGGIKTTLRQTNL